MKSLRVKFTPTDATGSTYDLLVPDGDRRGVLRNIKLRRDGTVAELCQVQGDADGLHATLDARDNILDYRLGTTADGDTLCYLRIDPTTTLVRVLELIEKHELVVDTPIPFDAASATAHVVGDAASLRHVAADFPDDMRDELTVEHIGDYTPDTDTLPMALTERQRDVLETAVNLGYYDTPRNATIDDIADALNCAPSTASEHLRKVESRVLTALV